ncbi:phosphorylase b kinase regulatory subunit beta, partial [Biomphalaria glabrata]
EVNFIQNLVFYVERAYRTPDYELIEHLGKRKYRNKSTEIHASIKAVNECNLFGEHGATWSGIFVNIDAHHRNRTILPWESNSE